VPIISIHFAPDADVRDYRPAHEFSRDHLQPDCQAKHIFEQGQQSQGGTQQHQPADRRVIKRVDDLNSCLFGEALDGLPLPASLSLSDPTFAALLVRK
jgi:hypothetical protein